MVFITVRNSAQITTGSTWTPHIETGVKARMLNFIAKYGQFDTIILQNISTELMQFKYDGDPWRNHFIQGSDIAIDDTEYYSNVIVINEGSGTIAAGELILTMDRPFNPLKAIYNMIQKALGKRLE